MARYREMLMFERNAVTWRPFPDAMHTSIFERIRSAIVIRP